MFGEGVIGRNRGAESYPIERDHIFEERGVSKILVDKMIMKRTDEAYFLLPRI